MFIPHLHSPSKTKILIVLFQELIAISKFQIGEGRKEIIIILILVFKQKEMPKTRGKNSQLEKSLTRKCKQQ